MARYDLHHGKSPLEVAIVTGAGAEIVEFTTNEALTAGDWVGLDTSQTGEDRVTEVVQGNADGMVIGVALETVASGATVRVCVSGYVEGALTDGNVAAAGDTLVAAASGTVTKGAPSNVLPIIGMALEVDAGSDPYYADVYIYRRF
tara:strand:+ start:1027 stop:1464 length:438 start_codon:yes stop_codon:yes gene_type:complete